MSVYIHRINDLLKKIFKGTGADPLEGLAPELQAVYPVDGDPLWNHIGRADVPFIWTQTNGPGGAGNFSTITLQNPPGSGVIAKVDMIVFNNLNAVAIEYFVRRQANVDAAGLAGTPAIHFRDLRTGGAVPLLG